MYIMIFEKVEVENSPILKHSWDAVMIKPWEVETDELWSSTWWLMKVAWFSNPCNGSRFGLSWMMLCKTSAAIAAYRWKMMLQISSKWCLDGFLGKARLSSLRVLDCFWKRQARWIFREWENRVSGCVFCGCQCSYLTENDEEILYQARQGFCSFEVLDRKW